ncbi:MAG: thioredoxin family protein [Oscillospiraceae bacterium]|nr:thioredoxin family protein [Oscillospiraceae bacterium]
MGKELIFQTMRHEPTERIPWVPFSGIHSGKLKGYTAEEILKDGNKLYECLMEVYRLYGPDGMPIMFDLQLEAEILGCDLMWARDNPPSVATHPLEGDDNKIVPCKCRIPTKESGRIPVMLEAMNKLKASIGDEVALYGLICGPFTMASHLRGSEIFLDMLMDEQYVKDLVGFCAEVAMRMTDYYLEAGMDVIAVVDPLISQVSPDSIDQLLKEPFTAVFDYIRSKGAFSSFFVCGNATPQLDVMCQCNPDSIAVDENVDFAYGKSVSDKYNIAISGNIPLTTVMLLGTPEDNMKYVVEKLVDRIPDHRNMIISPGCDMPYDVPPENTIACANAVKTPELAREVIKDYVGGGFDDIVVEMPDYANLKKPLIECFTLDSEQCAACTYMVAAANAAKEFFGDKIEDIIEYKFTKRENVARCKKMGVKNLPTMVINGEIRHISMIPDQDELRAEIQELIDKMG